jgi:hypothetical protein
VVGRQTEGTLAPDPFADSSLRSTVNGTGNQLVRAKADNFSQFDPIIMTKADKLTNSDMAREASHNTAAGSYLGDNTGHIISALGPRMAPHLAREHSQPLTPAHDPAVQTIGSPMRAYRPIRIIDRCQAYGSLP